MSLVLGVEILGEFKQLTAASKGAQSQLTGLNKKASAISSSINKAFGAIGIGLSFAMITRELTEAGKAAAEDAKSQALLAKQLENTTGATSSQIKAVEKVIGKLQLQASVADDELRPAYAKLIRSTKDTEEANRLLAIALDVSAGSGKSLDAVAQAMAKSVSGSDTALVKLLPSVKGMADPMAYLADQFKGAAEEAANTDPYQRMNIIFGEIQEQVGMALLPTLDKLSTWLSTPEGQEKLQGLVDLTTNLIGKFTTMLGFVIDNKEAFLLFAGAIGVVSVATQLLGVRATIASGQVVALGVAAKTALGTLGLVIAALETIKWLNESLAFTNANIAASGGSQGALNLSGQSGAKPSAGGSNMTFTAPKTATKAPVVVNNNIKISGTQSAQQIAKTLNTQLKASGSSTIIRGGR